MVSTFTLTDAGTQRDYQYATNNDANWAVAARSVGAFAPHAQASPNLTVAIDAGYVFNGLTVTAIAAQNTATLTAPATNPRNDIVYIDNISAAVGVAAGVESASPADPSLPAGKSPVARIAWVVGATFISNAMLTDLRALNSVGRGPFTSTDQTITAAGSLTLAHGLGTMPLSLTLLLVCQTADLNYAVNDIVLVQPGVQGSSAGNMGLGITLDATNISIRFGSAAGSLRLVNKTTGVTSAITNTRWKLRVIAYA